MKVYRLCNEDEIKSIAENGDYSDVGKSFESNPKKNTHNYNPESQYLHFFARMLETLYLSPTKGKYICEYDIPDEILKDAKGKGFYWDFVNFSSLHELEEYAVECPKIRFEYLKKVFKIKESIDFDYYPSDDEIKAYLEEIYNFETLKQKKFENSINRGEE